MRVRVPTAIAARVALITQGQSYAKTHNVMEAAKRKAYWHQPQSDFLNGRPTTSSHRAHQRLGDLGSPEERRQREAVRAALQVQEEGLPPTPRGKAAAREMRECTSAAEVSALLDVLEEAPREEWRTAIRSFSAVRSSLSVGLSDSDHSLLGFRAPRASGGGFGGSGGGLDQPSFFERSYPSVGRALERASMRRSCEPPPPRPTPCAPLHRSGRSPLTCHCRG